MTSESENHQLETDRSIWYILTSIGHLRAVKAYLGYLRNLRDHFSMTNALLFRNENKKQNGFSALLPPSEGCALSLKRERDLLEFRWMLTDDDYYRLQDKYNLKGWKPFTANPKLGNASMIIADHLPDVQNDFLQAWYKACASYCPNISSPRGIEMNASSLAMTKAMIELIDNPELISSFKQPIMEPASEEKLHGKMTALNTILYGPPGTGKTYNTINYALSIIEQKELSEIEAESDRDREAVKKRFDDLVIKDWDSAKGQIGFITFHQSLSYEDFIEGIKPDEPEGNEKGLTYSVQDGIFKKLCTMATIPNGNNFNKAYESLIKELAASLIGKVDLTTPNGALFQISLNRKGNLNLFTGPERKQAAMEFTHFK